MRHEATQLEATRPKVVRKLAVDRTTNWWRTVRRFHTMAQPTCNLIGQSVSFKHKLWNSSSMFLYVGLVIPFALLVIGGYIFGKSKRSKLIATAICLLAVAIFIGTFYAEFWFSVWQSITVDRYAQPRQVGM